MERQMSLRMCSSYVLVHGMQKHKSIYDPISLSSRYT